MPDHVHVVLEGQREDADMKRFVTAAKQTSAHYYRVAFQKRLWQRYSYDRVLRDDESMKQVVAYVLENPVRAGLSSRYTTIRTFTHRFTSDAN